MIDINSQQLISEPPEALLHELPRSIASSMFHEVQLNSFDCISSLHGRFPLVGPVGAASMQSTNHICLSIPFAARLACVRVCV